MPSRSLFLLIIFSALISASTARAQGRIDCNAMDSRILRQPVHYCVLLPPGYDAASAAHPPRRYPVLYFLHGLGSNEQSLFNNGGWDIVQDLWSQKQIIDFLVVAPDGKRSFFINSANSRVRYSDFFIREFIPFIEAHYSVQRERSARAISGVSMGGYGALRFAFAYPELFSSVSAESPALITASPRELDISMNLGTQLGRVLGPVFGDPINIAHWDANNPFALARKNRAQLKHLAIYFNCGRDDDFGFEKGAGELDRELRAEGVRHKFHLYPGNHSAAYFLQHLGEVLRFHSQAFAAAKKPER
jgi:putative tributyrin esterase